MQCFGWRMEEEAKFELTITINWRREDDSIATTQLETLDRSACRSAEDVGLQLADAKRIFGRLQEIVVSEQPAVEPARLPIKPSSLSSPMNTSNANSLMR
jgi:hypothetical protein